MRIAITVAISSGGVSGTAREILKYPAVEAVDYVELDPLVLEVAGQYVPESLDDPRIHVITTDGRLFVRRTHQQYDVILVDVPDPSTSQINRFYTREFFAEAHRRLAPGGVLSISLGRYENYLSPELADLIAGVGLSEWYEVEASCTVELSMETDAQGTLYVHLTNQTVPAYTPGRAISRSIDQIIPLDGIRLRLYGPYRGADVQSDGVSVREIEGGVECVIDRLTDYKMVTLSGFQH